MNRDINENQGQNQKQNKNIENTENDDIQDIQDIMNILNNQDRQNKNNRDNKSSDAGQIPPGQNPPRQARPNPGNNVVPSEQTDRYRQNINQNRPVRSPQQQQQQRANPIVAPRRPAPPNSQRSQHSNQFNQSNQSETTPPRQTGQNPQAAREANMTDAFQSGHTRTFDKSNKSDKNAKTRNSNNQNSGKSAQTRNSDGTYHYTGRDIKSSRQRFSEPENTSRRKKTPSDDDNNMKVSENKEKIKARNKNAEAESKRSGSIMSGILKVVLYILGVIIISGILAYNMIMIANDVFAFLKEPVAANVTIPEEVSIEQISQILYENKLIKYPKIFNFYINYRKKDAEWEFESGTYPVSSDMNYDEFVYTFRKKAAAREAVRVVIPEGFTIDQIIDEFVINNNMGTRDKFIEVINKTDFSAYNYRFLKTLYETELSPDRKYKLEGYLFPDTYDFYKDETELNIIIRFLDNFNSKFTEECYKKCEILDTAYLAATGRHFTIDDAIILASIVEREAKFPYDFEPISAVFHNRLLHSASFPRLESDATILYSYGQHKADLTDADLKEDLPYNTYTRSGLTPSAICNPGYEAITAALWPAEGDNGGPYPYYFFVANINTGQVYYAQTNAQHEANKILAKSGG
ncbi:MAG: endolytic transglycosylase MltG [Oscillospiraceae bacterium]|nr:endolytic transglycosylase MltG [Oscillospiraceae bacterium]